MEFKRSAEKIAVEREDLVLEFIKTGDIPVDLFAELSAFGGVVIAMAAFIAEKPQLVSRRSHKRNETGLPLFRHINEMMGEGVLVLDISPFFRQFPP